MQMFLIFPYLWAQDHQNPLCIVCVLADTNWFKTIKDASGKACISLLTCRLWPSPRSTPPQKVYLKNEPYTKQLKYTIINNVTFQKSICWLKTVIPGPAPLQVHLSWQCNILGRWTEQVIMCSALIKSWSKWAGFTASVSKVNQWTVYVRLWMK